MLAHPVTLDNQLQRKDKTMTGKINIRDTVTAQIIQAIEAGTPPWRKPWTGSTSGAMLPLRSTGEGYRGINILLLWCAAHKHSYEAAHWFTYKQAQNHDAQVRKGEKSSVVVKYGTIVREDDTGEEKIIPYLRSYRVFNADQVDGLPEKFYHKPAPPRDLGTAKDATLEEFFGTLGVPIDTTPKPKAYYSPSTDRVHMPPVETFFDASGYYGTLAHEMAHATGHKSRLDRFKKFQNREAYAFEELVAEIAACMLAAEQGFRPDFEQSAAYVEGWLKALNDDTSMIFRAASEAQKAVDLIKGEKALDK